MMRPWLPKILLTMVCVAGCHCSNGDLVELDSDAASGSSGDASSASAGSSEESTGEPFDASRWIGRYHFENVFLPFGERGNPHGSYSLVNFEILPDSRATMLYDHCSYDEPLVIEYVWLPSNDGWLVLQPGAGESSLRFMADPDVESVRVRLIEPCRELEFEVDGLGVSFTVVRPGESCWVDRCTTPGIMQVDYCPGEEPEEACP